MSRSYKFHDPEGTHFITFATVEWVDVFTRRAYKDILVDSTQILKAIAENGQESRKE